ncbi:cupin domain-containing protein [Photobacterium rosenbergii]|uniref:Cupin domain-containing protein n=1 Tax=Photobacterium rosenbergii TaxID=294936 RepID=A0ABU3ZNJ6_9GAMM|nr:cupin domain-containing protein [Photobacterium rosenbergii]MDV5171597.1 cupin domain-containing protein [Photobacterium rosenbergii]
MNENLDRTTPEELNATNYSGTGIFSRGEENKAYADYFTGTSYLELLNREGVGVFNVTFEPGCRNYWHIHHKGGQILLVTGGRGWYQEEGKPAQELHAGDVVHIAPGTKHWHGAAKDSWFAHVAIEIPAEGASNEWFGPVTEQEYDALQ